MILTSRPLGFIAACALAGCAVTPVAPNVETPGMSNAEVALQRSMDETAGELSRIGAIEPSAAVASMPTVVPGELDRVVSMSWSGALEGAVKRLGETVGYRTVVSGKAPKGGVTVVVDPPRSASTTSSTVSATRWAAPRWCGSTRSTSSSR